MSTITEHCPCCGSDSINRYMIVPTDQLQFPLLRCAKCSHAWLQTGDAHESIEEAYDKDYSGHRFDSYFEAQCRKAIDNDIGPLIPAPATLLDVGCGNGGFLLAAEDAGYKAVGIDISSQAIKIANERGCNALLVDFTSHNFGRNFDIVTMWDVVEHLKDPCMFFRRARELLSPGGILVIKTPGVGPSALALARFQPQWAGGLLQAPHHVQYWTNTSMEAIMLRSGFEEVLHWPSRPFRSEPEASSATRKFRRIVRNGLLKLSGSGNIFCAGRTRNM